ncbi:MAG: hypothetical protein ACXV95_02915 [Acidimicrobiales bacterium]
MLQQTIQKREGQTISTVVGPWPTLAWAVLSIAAAWFLQRRRPADTDELERPEPASGPRSEDVVET